MDSSDDLFWEVARLSEAIDLLARRGGFAVRGVELQPLPKQVARAGDEALGQWIEAAANWLGLEAERREVSYAEAEEFLRRASATLIHIRRADEAVFLAVLHCRRRIVSVIGTDFEVHKVKLEALCDALCHEAEAPLSAEVHQLIEEIGVRKRHRARTRAALLRQRLGAVRVASIWSLRLAPGASVWSHARYARLPQRVVALIFLNSIQYGLFLLSWWLVGRLAFGGRFDRGWLLAWALLLLTIIPFRLLSTWLAGLLAIGGGGILKQRLLYGALRLEPEEIRREGVGQLLGRVIEGEAVESLALSGGFLGVVAAVELVAGVIVLSLGASSALHPLLLLGWATLTVLLGWRYARQRRCWTHFRLGMTHSLVENMIGYRTRLAQERREQWHEGEDRQLEQYLVLSSRLDRTATLLTTFVPRGWLLAGLAGLAPVFASGNSSPEAIAISIGGILLAHQAFEKVTLSMSYIVGAAIAWQQVAPLYDAASRPALVGLPNFTVSPRPATQGSDGARPVIEAHDLVFRYRKLGEPVLHNCSLRIHVGDRVLLGGSSGGGKSTLASLLTGLRSPESGLLLLDGFDRQTLGTEGWQRRVVAAPQFHENHVLTETFSFNLLMGRRWPPQESDIVEAEVVCRELGLGDLLGRMPAGFEQMVGESGWQLSHGERSRLYIARALLQSVDVVVLDESFAALDPENLQRAVDCVVKRARTLLVIAHR